MTGGLSKNKAFSIIQSLSLAFASQLPLHKGAFYKSATDNCQNHWVLHVVNSIGDRGWILSWFVCT